MKKIKYTLSIFTYLFLLINVNASFINLVSENKDLREGINGFRSYKRALIKAKETWEDILKSDENITINVEAIRIDGPHNILGKAGPTKLNPYTYLPITGMMYLDIDDLKRIGREGALENVITHEMAHVLGFGTIWDKKGLLTSERRNPVFIGEHTVKIYRSMKRSTRVRYVPLSNTGGRGTYGSHWKESVFGNELMTGYIDDGLNPISLLTIASFRDLGYEVDYSKAQEYTLPTIALGRSTKQPPDFRKSVVLPTLYEEKTEFCTVL